MGIRKIQLRPDAEQKQLLRRIMGARRFFYNQAVATHQQYQKEGCTMQESVLRRDILTKETRKPEKHPMWAEQIPYDIKDEALRDYWKAFQINVRQKRPFRMQFRSRKRRDQESFVFHKKHWVHQRGFYAALKKIRSVEALPQKLPADCRITGQCGKYYIHLPVYENTTLHALDDTSKRDVVALDPGVRTFMSAYDPDGYCFEWAHHDNMRLRRLQEACRRLQSMMDQSSKGRRRKLQKAQDRIRDKLSHLVDDTQFKLIRFLTKTYKHVLLPSFQSKQMMQLKLNKKTKQELQLWRHYTFRQRLIARAKLVGCHIHIVDEHYTSRTCTACGYLNAKDTKKSKRCHNCQHEVDRDINGARNVFLKTCSDLKAGMTRNKRGTTSI